MSEKPEEKKAVEKKPEAKKAKTIVAVGKRKKAVARATITEGNGVVRVNKNALATIRPDLLRLKIEEPLIIAGGELAGTVNIDVDVRGGGINAQAEAARQAIARGLAAMVRGKELKQRFAAYDRTLLVSDPRRTEPHKFSRSSKGARRKRQLSKR